MHKFKVKHQPANKAFVISAIRATAEDAGVSQNLRKRAAKHIRRIQDVEKTHIVLCITAIKEDELWIYRSIQKQKMAFTGQELLTRFLVNILSPRRQRGDRENGKKSTPHRIKTPKLIAKNCHG